MKKVLLCIMLLLINSSTLKARRRRCCVLAPCQLAAILQSDRNIVTILNQITNIINYIKNQKTCDDSIIQIRQSDIPYFITDPGEYCLAEDITITSGDAITIVAIGLVGKKVVLDLNNKTINGSGTADNGIIVVLTKFVLPVPIGLEIKNGTIIGMKEHGIYIPFGLGDLIIDSMVINACGITGGETSDQGGIVVGGSQGAYSPTIRNCRVQGAGPILSAGYGIYLRNSLNGQISHCISTLNGLDGIVMENDSIFFGGRIDNCTSSSNKQDGIRIVSHSIVSHSVVIENCITEQNSLTGIVVSANNCAILNNISNNNTINGLSIAGNNCEVRSNTATSNAGDGFNDSGTTNRIYGNYANNNTTNNYSASIVNVATSPAFNAAINHTANIAD